MESASSSGPAVMDVEAHRAVGAAYFESVVATANKGKDPFKQQPPKARNTPAVPATEQDPDVAAFGAAVERHKGLLILAALVVAQAFSWVLMKVGTGGRKHTQQSFAQHSGV